MDPGLLSICFSPSKTLRSADPRGDYGCLLTCVACRVGAALIAAITVRRKERGIMPDR
jgi:hypothetical protein